MKNKEKNTTVDLAAKFKKIVEELDINDPHVIVKINKLKRIIYATKKLESDTVN